MGSRKEEIGRHCPYCGAMVSYDEYFCRSCHKRFTDQNDLDAPSTRQPDTYVVSVRRAYASAFFSLIGVGLGQFYNGDTLRGLAFFLGFIAISFTIITVPHQSLLFYGIWLAALAEALWSSRRINRYERPFGGVSYLLYGMLAVFGLIAALPTATGEPDLVYLGRVFPLVHLYSG